MIKQITTDSGNVVNYYKTVFISDLHMATHSCQIDNFLYFLDHNHFDTIFIIGDFIDGWVLDDKRDWNQKFSDAVSKILKKTRYGTKIIYIIGNHDEFLNNYDGLYGNLEIVREAIYQTCGKKFIVMHGHEFDSIVKNMRWLSRFSSEVYDFFIYTNKVVNSIRRFLKIKGWSLSNYLKSVVKNAMECIDNYENLIKDYAKKNSADGIICGHLHQPKLEISETIYINTGDFVDNSTVILETFDGDIYLNTYIDCSEKVISNIKLL